ncbi:MAG: DUF4256 domain-containing protein, partial [Planctomycetota bacterium]
MNKTDRATLLATLQQRFAEHPERHQGITWAQVQQRLDAHPKALSALFAMESTGGEPDVIARDGKSGEVTFCDCARETPSGRRSLCYDRDALDARKEHKPEGNVVDTATAMGVEILTEAQYR